MLLLRERERERERETRSPRSFERERELRESYERELRESYESYERELRETRNSSSYWRNLAYHTFHIRDHLRDIYTRQAHVRHTHTQGIYLTRRASCIGDGVAGKLQA